MPAFPSKSDLTGIPKTKLAFRNALGQLVDALAGLLGTDGAAATARTTLGAAGLTGDETIAGNKTFSGTNCTVPNQSSSDNSGKIANTAFVTAKVGQAWPVGSVFISVVATNPETLLGYGTWVAFGTGRTLVGIDAGQTEFNTVEEVGGAKTHALTSAENGPHTHSMDHYHNIPTGGGAALSPYITARSADINSTANATVTHTGNTGSTGSGTPHNNLQPYIVVYMWKRTA